MSKIYVVGLGPGGKPYMSPEATEAILASDVVVGYKTYMKFVEHLTEGKELDSSGMRKEIDRANQVIDYAKAGKSVALISSGDAGVYGMAGILLELADETMDVVVVPGITAANSAAACLGAPIMHDYVTISLSDLLTDWELIKKRIHCAGEGDFVVALYNPKSMGRQTQIVEAREILMKYKAKETPVGIVENAKRDGQKVTITTLGDMLSADINMFTTVIIGNSKTYVKGDKIITPRGYKI